jgi:hypothetical protein
MSLKPRALSISLQSSELVGLVFSYNQLSTASITIINSTCLTVHYRLLKDAHSTLAKVYSITIRPKDFPSRTL